MPERAAIPRAIIWFFCLMALLLNVLVLAEVSRGSAPSIAIQHTEGPAVDHVAFWSAGRIANQGAAAEAYDPAALTAVQSAGLGYDYRGEMLWFYHPLAQIMAQPFALLPPVWSLIVWNALGIAALLVVVWRIIPDPLALMLTTSAGPVFSVLYNGQIGLFIAAIAGMCLLSLVTDLAERDANGRRTGAWLALLLLKPPTVFAVPVAMAVAGRWRPILAAVALGLVLIAISALIQGVGGWTAFLQTLTGTSDYFMTGDKAPAFWPKYANLYGAARANGVGFWPAAIGQSALVIAGLALAIGALRAPAVEPAAVAAIIAYACVVSAPRVYGYDLPILLIGTAFQARAATRLGWGPGETGVLMVSFALVELGFLGRPHLAALAGPLLITYAFWRYVYSARARGRA